MHYKGNETHVAVAREVEVDVKSDVIQVTRMAYTHDCGLVGNQDAVRSKTEDNLLHTLSWTLHEEVKFDRLRVNSTDWENYRMLTFPKVSTLLIDVIDRPDQSRLGARDAGATPVLAALADAAFNACGIRLRTTPVTSDKVKALLLA